MQFTNILFKQTVYYSNLYDRRIVMMSYPADLNVNKVRTKEYCVYIDWEKGQEIEFPNNRARTFTKYYDAYDYAMTLTGIYDL